MSFGSRLKAFREEIPLKQDEMAEKLKMKVDRYRTYEQDTREPKFEVLSQFVVLGADLHWLLTGNPSPSITTKLENPSPSPQLLPSGSKDPPVPSQRETELLKQQIELLKKDNEHLKAQSVSQNTVLLALQEQIKDLRELTVAQKDHSDTQKEVIRLLKEQQAAHRSTPTKQYAPVAQSHS